MVNGTRAIITPVRDGHGLDSLGDDGTRLHLPAVYLQAGHVAHGYAITGHKAQGLTVDHTFVLATDATYREWGYVALSRGRHTNRLYVHEHDELDLDGGPHTREPHQDPIATTVARLSRTRAQQPVSEPPGVRLTRLADWLASPDVRQARQLDRHVADRDQIDTALDEYRQIHRQPDRQVARRVAAVTHDPPDYLLATLGRPPAEHTRDLGHGLAR